MRLWNSYLKSTTLFALLVFPDWLDTLYELSKITIVENTMCRKVPKGI